MDLVVEVPAVAGRGAGDEDEDEREGAADPGQRAPARAPLWRSMRGPASPGVPAPWFRAPPSVARLVDLAPQLVQPVFDRVGRCGGAIGGGLTRGGISRRTRVCVDLAPQLVQPLLNGVVLGFVRTHRAVVWVTCDRMIWSAPMPPRWLRLGGRNAW